MSEVKKIGLGSEILVPAKIIGIRQNPYPEEQEYRLEINEQLVEVSESYIFGKEIEDEN